jgi:hypothetical protein
MTLWVPQTGIFFHFMPFRPRRKKGVFPSCFPSEKGVWLGAESNRRHVDFQSTALPTELPSRFTKSTVTGYLQNRGVHYANFRDWGKEEPVEREWSKTRCVSGSKRITLSSRRISSDGLTVRPYHRSVDEFSRQFYCAPQKSQIVIPRNLDPAELLQVRRQPLRVEQNEFSRAQMFHQRHERDL